MAGTVPRRWNGNGGGRLWGPVSRVAGPVSSAKVFGLVSGYVEFDSGNTQFCGALVAPVPSGTETEPNGAKVHDAVASPGAFETDLGMHSSMVQRLSWASRCPRAVLLSRTFSTVQ